MSTPSKRPCVQKEAQGGEVIALSVGGETAMEALKHALAMGADEAVLISDPALGAADSQAVAYVLCRRDQKARRGGPGFLRAPGNRRRHRRDPPADRAPAGLALP